MDWNLTVYTLPPLVAAVLSAGLVRLAWDSRAERMARTFILLTVCIGLWAAVDAIQLSLTGGLGSTLALESVGLVISAFIPTLWLLLAVEYAGYDHLLDRNVLGLLLVEPVLFGLLVVTNPVHRLVIREAGLRATGPVLVLERTFGPAYAVHLLYAYLLVVVGIGLFVHVAVGRSVLHRKQAAVMCAGAVVPLGANIGTNLGLSPLPGVDLTTFAFALTALFFGVALFALDLLDLAKVAKSRLLEELGDGFLIADRDGDVVDYNGIAARVLSPTPTVGMPATRTLPTDSFDGADGELIEDDAEDGRRFYDVEHTALHDHRDRRVGDVVGLRDVTDRTEYERRMTIANRVLRHNVRNEMNVVLAQTEHLENELGETPEPLEAIRHHAKEVVELGEDAREISRSADIRGDDAVVDVVPVVESIVADGPEIVSLADDIPDRAEAEVTERKFYETAIEELVENAIEHNDGPDPEVVVDVTTTEAEVTVTVADNGPGIPEGERKVLRQGRETALHHGSGLGLWVVYWFAVAADGEVRFRDCDPTGSEVDLAVPRPT